ncbi:LysR family transcriptional regulator [Paraburkholderia fungorum]
MRFNKLDLNLLVALDAMLQERSVSRAAERIHLSQSAMSNALARLREYFGDELLMQVGRKMELTPRGTALRVSVREVLMRVNTTIATQPEFDPRSSDRRFRLIISDYSAAILIPTILKLAYQEAPSVSFELIPPGRDQTSVPHLLLERGEVDLLVIPSVYCSPEHPSECLFEDEYKCVVWSENSWIRGDSLSIEQYRAAGHVVVILGIPNQLAFDSLYLRKHGIERREEVTTSNFMSPPQLVIGTDRIATVQEHVLRSLGPSLPLRVYQTPFLIPQMKESIQWHKYRELDQGLTWLSGLFHQAAREISGLP